MEFQQGIFGVPSESLFCCSAEDRVVPLQAADCTFLNWSLGFEARNFFCDDLEYHEYYNFNGFSRW